MNARQTYLVQTDTTAGFVSQDLCALNRLKGRKDTQPCLKTVFTCKALIWIARVPRAYKRKIRKDKNHTFLYPNGEACRLVKDRRHGRFLKDFGWMYSTSANATGKTFEREYATEKVAIIVEDKEGFHEAKASTLMKLGRARKRRLR